MTVPPEKVPSEPINEKTIKGFVPVEIAVGIAVAFCLVAAVVPQFQKFAEHYAYASAVGDGATFIMNALMVLAVMGGVIVVGARAILKNELGRPEHCRDEDEVAADG